MIVPFLELLDSEEDKQKFSSLYQQYHNLLMWVAMERLHNHSLAEESAQDAWLYIATHFQKVQEVDSKQTKIYVSTIADSFAVDKLRKEKKVISFPADAVIIDETAEQEFFDNIDKLDISIALKKIDPLQRDILRLTYQFGYTSKEIGEMLGKKDSYIRKMLQFARQSLRTILEDKEND